MDALVGIFFAAWLGLILFIQLQSETNLSLGQIIQSDTHLGRHPLQGLPGGKIRRMAKKPPVNLKEVEVFLSNWLTRLHEHLAHYKKSKAEEIWEAFHNITIHTLLPWDQEYLHRMPERRSDGSIFLSVASYRDDNCLATLQEAYRQAEHPDNLFVGLIQQNCLRDCRSGIMEDGKSRPVDPDPDCHKLFCASEVGKPHCEAGRLRALHIEEPESLGPYMARYFASKLWNGEQWYMQVRKPLERAEIFT
jgi:Glycosyltransferase (GlcNAc)